MYGKPPKSSNISKTIFRVSQFILKRWKTKVQENETWYRDEESIEARNDETTLKVPVKNIKNYMVYIFPAIII